MELSVVRDVRKRMRLYRTPQSRVSTHLGCLRWCGLVQTRRDGKQVYYRVADPCTRELLALGDTILREHAAALATCSVLG
jgi:ArsR family transcriptional regulator